MESSCPESLPARRLAWWVTALFSSLVSIVLLFVVVQLRSTWGWVLVGTGVAVFLLVLFRNPLFWYRRLAATVVTAWLGLTATAGFSAFVQFRPESFGGFASNNVVGPTFHIVVCILVLALLFLDFLNTKKAVTKVTLFDRRIREARSDLERETHLAELSESSSLQLLLQIRQEKSRFFALDTRNLTKKGQAELALQQVRLHFQLLLVRERRWLIGAGVVIVLIIVGGAMLSDELRARRDTSWADQIEYSARITGVEQTIEFSRIPVGTPVNVTLSNLPSKVEVVEWESRIPNTIQRWNGSQAVYRSSIVDIDELRVLLVRDGVSATLTIPVTVIAPWRNE